MCGISGLVSTTNIANHSNDILHHRGPDAQGCFQTVHKDKHILLNHWRLSIIDLSEAGNQPMSTGDKAITLVFNGEIYNYTELRARHLKNQSFRSRTDTETILYLYQKYGSDLFNLLNGDFALALYDKPQDRIILARDRMGIKPLYYYSDSTRFAFASEIKAFRAMEIQSALAKENLENYFVFKYLPEQQTLFKNIFRLQPGHYLQLDVRNMEITIHPYWQLEKKTEYATLSFKDAIYQLKDMIQDAVQGQLMSDVPLGNFFSGGIDSSIIAWYLREQKEITHYTARKSEADLKKEGSSSDYHYALHLADTWGLNLVAIDIGAKEANPQLIAKTMYYSDDLIADGSQIPSFLITAEAGKKSRVMLSGMGADELFLGYAGHQISLLSNYLQYLPGGMSKGLAGILATLKPGRGAFKPYKRFLKKLGTYAAQGTLNYGFLNIVGDYQTSLSTLNRTEDTALAVFNKYFLTSNDPFESINRFELNNFLIKNLHYLDRMCMAHSVEGRVPFLDYRLVEFAFSLPREYKLTAAGKTKHILKETFRRKLPQSITKRRKAGFGMPLRSLFSDDRMIDTLLDFNYLGDLGLFSLQNIKALITHHQQGQEDNSALIYALISFQAWHKLFFSEGNNETTNTTA